jgi:hypothetical protein
MIKMWYFIVQYISNIIFIFNLLIFIIFYKSDINKVNINKDITDILHIKIENH